MMFWRPRRTWSAIALLSAICVCSPDALPAERKAPRRYVTTPFLEPDRCATAWVISRYVDKNASFEFHEREDIPPGVILYDLPETDLKRDARRATVEVLVQRENLKGSFVLRLARLVHDVEINAWARRDEEGSVAFERTLMAAFRAAKTPERALGACFELLDRLRSMDGNVDAWERMLAGE